MMRLALGAKWVWPRVPGTVVGCVAALPKRSCGLRRLASAAAPSPPALRRMKVLRESCWMKDWGSSISFLCRGTGFNRCEQQTRVENPCHGENVSFLGDGLIHVED